MGTDLCYWSLQGPKSLIQGLPVTGWCEVLIGLFSCLRRWPHRIIVETAQLRLVTASQAVLPPDRCTRRNWVSSLRQEGPWDGAEGAVFGEQKVFRTASTPPSPLPFWCATHAPSSYTTGVVHQTPLTWGRYFVLSQVCPQVLSSPIYQKPCRMWTLIMIEQDLWTPFTIPHRHFTAQGHSWAHLSHMTQSVIIRF